MFSYSRPKISENVVDPHATRNKRQISNATSILYEGRGITVDDKQPSSVPQKVQHDSGYGDSTTPYSAARHDSKASSRQDALAIWNEIFVQEPATAMRARVRNDVNDIRDIYDANSQRVYLESLRDADPSLRQGCLDNLKSSHDANTATYSRFGTNFRFMLCFC